MRVGARACAGCRPSRACSRACRASLLASARSYFSGCSFGVHVRRRDRRQQRRARRPRARGTRRRRSACGRTRARGRRAASGSSSSRFFFFFGIRVEAEVADLGALALDELDVARLAELVGDGERHRVDVVEAAALERREHRVGVREPGDADRVDVRLRAVEAGVAREDRRALLVVLRDEEGAAADDRQVRARGRSP